MRGICPCGALRGRDSTQEVSAIGRRMSGHCGRKSPGARRRPRRCPRRRKDNRGHADSPSKGAVQSWCRWRRRSKRRLLVQSRTLSKTRKPTNAAAPANTHQNSKAFFNLAQPLRKRQSTQASQQFSLWPCHPPPGEGTRPTPPQNRPLVGRVPSPGVPIWSIMRIAASFSLPLGSGLENCAASRASRQGQRRSASQSCQGLAVAHRCSPQNGLAWTRRGRWTRKEHHETSAQEYRAIRCRG